MGNSGAVVVAQGQALLEPQARLGYVWTTKKIWKVHIMKIFTQRSLAVIGLVLGCATANAEVTGGQIKVSQSGFTDDFSVAKTNVSGALELGFGAQFGLQLDLGVNMLNFADETATNIAAHGTYKLSDSTALGAFYGMDRIGGGQNDFFGVEAAKNFGTGGVQGYLARGEDSGDSGTVLGISGGAVLGNGFGLGASLDHGAFDGGASLTRLGLRGSFGLGEQSNMYAEIGTLNGEIDGLGSDSETYAKIGTTFNFGANSGPTFGDRSLFNLLPGL